MLQTIREFAAERLAESDAADRIRDRHLEAFISLAQQAQAQLFGRQRKEWLDRLEVTDVSGKRPGDVSGGQGQRVAVARALVTGPKVIFADEPTGALDSLNGERVMGLLVAAAKETGAAVVLVTHEARVAAYSDREVIVRDGRTREMELSR